MPFPYFGRKGSRLAPLYPYPRFDTIIEPFAGSAGYSLWADHWTRDVILIEKDREIYELWDWLIDWRTTADIIADLPDMVQGAPLDALVEDPRPRKLLQLSSPSEDHQKKTASSWMVEKWPAVRERIAANVHKVKHWTILEGDYSRAPDIEATWFIDPPYQKIQYGYGRDSREQIDFEQLGAWSTHRQGQIIVCEQLGADWLDFEPLTALRTIDNTDTIEAIWTNEKGTLF